MAKRPAEFPTDWHYESHIEALKREVQGCHDKLTALAGLDPSDLDNQKSRQLVESELEATLAELAHYGKGQAKASKRPKAAAAKAEKRA